MLIWGNETHITEIPPPLTQRRNEGVLNQPGLRHSEDSLGGEDFSEEEPQEISSEPAENSKQEDDLQA